MQYKRPRIIRVDYSILDFKSSIQYIPELQIGFGSWEKYTGEAFLYDFEDNCWLYKKGNARKKGVPLTVVEISHDNSEFYFETVYKNKTKHFKLLFEYEIDRAILRFFKKVWDEGFPRHEIKINHCSPCISTYYGQIEYMSAMDLEPDGNVISCRGVAINLKKYNSIGHFTDKREEIVKDEFVFWHKHHIKAMNMEGEKMTIETITGNFTHPVRTITMLLETWTEVINKHIPY